MFSGDIFSNWLLISQTICAGQPQIPGPNYMFFASKHWATHKWMTCLSSRKQMGSISIAQPIFKQGQHAEKWSCSNEEFDLQVLLSSHSSSKNPSIRQRISKQWVSHACFPCSSQPLIKALQVLCSYSPMTKPLAALTIHKWTDLCFQKIGKGSAKNLLKRRVSAKSRYSGYSSFPKWAFLLTSTFRLISYRNK